MQNLFGRMSDTDTSYRTEIRSVLDIKYVSFVYVLDTFCAFKLVSGILVYIHKMVISERCRVRVIDGYLLLATVMMSCCTCLGYMLHNCVCANLDSLTTCLVLCHHSAILPPR